MHNNNYKISRNQSGVLSDPPINRARLIMTIILFGLLLSPAAWAHRGAVDEIDPCNVRVGPESVHFTAYTPDISGSRGYCNIIPELGKTHLVFDYGGKALRDISVEFEITKEPEGQRIFYQEPEKVKTGSFNGIIDFTEHGTGNYLAHITIVDNDKQIDSHIPFSVGLEDPDKFNFIPLLTVFGLLTFVVLVFKFSNKDKPLDTHSDKTES